MRKSIIAILMTFCLSIMTYAQTPRDRATELKEQAQSSLNQKDYIKARYLFKKAYEAFATRENYPQAIESGVQANALYVRENFYKEGFELCRDMDQLIWAGEQNQKKVFYDLRFLVNKERLQMYTALKNPAQAKTQLNKLEETANLAKNDSLTEVLLYTKANYYYTFNQNTQGDACFRKLINQYKEKKDYAKVSDCYKNLIGIARKANNAPLMERTYESYIVWTDSVKALTAQDELNVLKRKYDESQLTIQEKDDTLSAKQYIIIGLCVLVVILVAGLAILAAILLKFIAGNRKLKKSVKIANEHNELKTKFIQNISSQMEPTLNTLATSANELLQKAPQEASQMQSQIAALKKFSDDIQELSSLENSLTELYELGEINVGTFCENVMDKVKEHLDADIKNSDLSEYVSQVLIPTEKVYQVRNGKKIVKERSYLPGYVLVEAALVGEVAHHLRNTPNVIGFLGGSENPVPLRQSEVNRILGTVDELQEGGEELNVPYTVGETVKVTVGPFSGFSGLIEEVNTEKRKLKVMVKIFGRKTPLELGFMDVEKE